MAMIEIQPKVIQETLQSVGIQNKIQKTSEGSDQEQIVILLTPDVQESQRILLLSNKPTTGVLWVYSLQQQKIDVILEQDPSSAMDSWPKVIPDLIVIDLNLPLRQILYVVKSLRSESIMPILVLIQSMNEDETKVHPN